MTNKPDKITYSTIRWNDKNCSFNSNNYVVIGCALFPPHWYRQKCKRDSFHVEIMQHYAKLHV